jgi:hypothetical protein
MTGPHIDADGRPYWTTRDLLDTPPRKVNRMTNERLASARKIIADHVAILEYVLRLPEAPSVDPKVREAAYKELADARQWLATPDEPSAKHQPSAFEQTAPPIDWPEPKDERALVADDVRVYGVGITVHTPDGVKRVPPQDVIFKKMPPVNTPAEPAVTPEISEGLRDLIQIADSEYMWQEKSEDEAHREAWRIREAAVEWIEAQLPVNRNGDA